MKPPDTVRFPKDSEIANAILFRGNISAFKDHQKFNSRIFGGTFYAHFYRLVDDTVAYIDGDDVVVLADYAAAAKDAFRNKDHELPRIETQT